MSICAQQQNPKKMQSRTFGTATFINGSSTGSTKQSNFYSKSPFGGFRGLPAKNCCISVVAWKMQQFATTPNEPTILQEIPCSLQVKTYYENNAVVAFRNCVKNATTYNNLTPMRNPNNHNQLKTKGMNIVLNRIFVAAGKMQQFTTTQHPRESTDTNRKRGYTEPGKNRPALCVPAPAVGRIEEKPILTFCPFNLLPFFQLNSRGF